MTHPKLIEVAKAMYWDEPARSSWEPDSPMMAWEDLSEGNRKAYIRQARVALEAVFEPSEEMKYYGWFRFSGYCPDPANAKEGAETDIWQAMLHTILNEGDL